MLKRLSRNKRTIPYAEYIKIRTQDDIRDEVNPLTRAAHLHSEAQQNLSLQQLVDFDTLFQESIWWASNDEVSAIYKYEL